MMIDRGGREGERERERERESVDAADTPLFIIGSNVFHSGI